MLRSERREGGVAFNRCLSVREPVSIGTSAWQLSVFSLVFGACYGGFVALYAAITVDYFGGRNASGIIGLLYTGGAAGSFVGPTLAGEAFDVFGSYTIPIAIGAGCAAIAVGFLIVAPEPAPHSPG